MENIKWLEKWFYQNCDGEWEHSYGIEIGTLDNPGWYVNIDLKETDYADISFPEMIVDNSETDWISCSLVDGIFKGVGDSQKLNVIIQTFRAWVEEKSQ